MRATCSRRVSDRPDPRPSLRRAVRCHRRRAPESASAGPLCRASRAQRVFGWLGIVACYLLAARLGGPSAGLLAVVLLAVTPRYWGDAMNNPKDLPFATCATAALVVHGGDPGALPLSHARTRAGSRRVNRSRAERASGWSAVSGVRRGRRRRAGRPIGGLCAAPSARHRVACCCWRPRGDDRSAALLAVAAAAALRRTFRGAGGRVELRMGRQHDLRRRRRDRRAAALDLRPHVASLHHAAGDPGGRGARRRHAGAPVSLSRGSLGPARRRAVSGCLRHRQAVHPLRRHPASAVHRAAIAALAALGWRAALESRRPAVSWSPCWPCWRGWPSRSSSASGSIPTRRCTSTRCWAARAGPWAGSSSTTGATASTRRNAAWPRWPSAPACPSRSRAPSGAIMCSTRAGFRSWRSLDPKRGATSSRTRAHARMSPASQRSSFAGGPTS